MKRNKTEKVRVLETYNPDNHPKNLYIPQCIIVEEIFPRLPIKSLLKFKSLSKQWYFIISSTQFAQLHVQHQCSTNSSLNNSSHCLLVDLKGDIYTLNWVSYSSFKEELTLFREPIYTNFHPSLARFLGSSNGLLCSLHDWDYYFVWNPPTNKHRRITSTLNKACDLGIYDDFLGGFGYVSSIDDYKIVQIIMFKPPRPMEVCIFTLSVGVWTHLKINTDEKLNFIVKCKINEKDIVVNPGMALVNDTLHWLLSVSPHYKFLNDFHILAFDLVKEEMHEIRPPKALLEEGFVSVVQGCLCLYDITKFLGLVEMWTMEEYGIWRSWKKLLKVELHYGFDGFKASSLELIWWACANFGASSR